MQVYGKNQLGTSQINAIIAAGHRSRKIFRLSLIKMRKWDSVVRKHPFYSLLLNFDSSLKNSKSPIKIHDLGQFLESQFAIMYLDENPSVKVKSSLSKKNCIGRLPLLQEQGRVTRNRCRASFVWEITECFHVQRCKTVEIKLQRYSIIGSVFFVTPQIPTENWANQAEMRQNSQWRARNSAPSC